LRRLDELAADPSLAAGISMTRATLVDPQLLRDVCGAVRIDADAAIAGEILLSAGPTGAEALLDSYVASNDQTRSLLRPVLRSMSEPILGVARSRVRSEAPARAVEILRTLGALSDRRAIPAISQGLAHLDEQVRFTAITTLADSAEPDAANALVKVLGHSEPETQRFAVREIGRVRAASAVHQLTRALEDLNVLQRTHELKKEIIRSLERIATPEAQRALKRTADRRFVWGRKTRELRSQARLALEAIEQAQQASPKE
jgi:HEAT repeat protein